jgi:uncharacterized protein
MTPQETTLLNEFLSQLTAVRGIAKDPAADTFIAQAIAQQPDAAYLLVQRCLLLDQAIESAKQQIDKLESELRGARAPAPAAAGFLSGAKAWGRGPVVSSAPALASASGHMRSTTAPLGAQPTSGGGGFLGRAAATAAGVVGGAFLFQGISQLMGNRAHTPEASSQASAPAATEGLLANSFANDAEPAPATEQYDTAMDDSAGSDDSSSEA